MSRPLQIRALGRLAREWDWGLYTLILLYMALPQVYRSYSIYLIGNAIPDTSALATVAQWQFVELMLEVVQETFVLAIFYFVGRSAPGGDPPGVAMRTALTLILGFSGIIAAALFVFASAFVDVIGTPAAIQATTTSFLRVKAFGVPVALLVAAMVIMVETVNRKRLILTIALSSVLYRLILDSLFYGGYGFSFDLGVMGVAWADTLTNVALLLTAFVLLRSTLTEQVAHWIQFFSLRDWRIYLQVSLGSGIDSLVRNLAYFFMIVRLLNLLGTNAIGGYYLAMYILWGFLLVPVLALAESSKVLVASRSADLIGVRRLWMASMAICAVMVAVWVVLVPLWRPFATFLNPNEAIVDNAVQTLVILFIPYALLAFNLVTDSVFYGIGRTRYMAYQSVITNGTAYVAAFLAYAVGLWNPTLYTILLLFAFGILIDSALTITFLFRVLSVRPREGVAVEVTV